MMNKSKPVSRRLAIWIIAALIPVLTWYAYVNFRSNPRWINQQPSAYYELLTEALISGQTHLKLQPDERLKNLDNPWAGGQGIPRAHDATYFNDRYYLYFGVGPVILLLAPWRIITGSYLSDGAAIGIFCSLGFLLAAWFYVRCYKIFFKNLSPVWVFIALISLGLGSFIQFELRSSEFYHVPIASAFLCAMIVAHAILWAAIGKSWQFQTWWVAIACTAGAAAVGSRPNFLIALIATLFGVFIIYYKWSKAEGIWSKPARRIFFSALIPIMLIGLMLAIYNYQRFGDFKEFGIRYQFAAIDMRNMKLLGFEFIAHAFEGYFLAGREYTTYYPFIRQTTENISLFYWAPFALISLALPLTLLNQKYRSRAWIVGVGALLSAALANLLTLLFYFYVFDRYVMDFLPGLMLVALITFSVFLNSKFANVILKKALTIVGLLILVYTYTHSFIHGMPVGIDWPEIGRFAKLANRLPYYYERWTGREYGGVEAEIVFKSSSAGAKEPIVVTAGGRDLIYVKYLGANRAQLGFFHMGSGGPLSREFEFIDGLKYHIKIDLGSMYPPRGHGVYAGWTEGEVSSLLRRVEVSLNDQIMLKFASSMHQHEPAKIMIGSNPDSSIDGQFQGVISAVRRLGIPEPDQIGYEAQGGPVILKLQFPPFVATFAQPLLSTGIRGAGDIVYVFYEGPNRVRFAHDCWSRALVETESVYYDPSLQQIVEIDLPNFNPRILNPLDGSGHLRIRFNGRILYDKPRPSHPFAPGEFYLGHNAINSSSAEHNFNGMRFEYQRAQEIAGAQLDGAYYFRLRLPKMRVGRTEPLLVSGANGAGEIIYIRYADSGHIQIGYDKWNYGGPISVPIPCGDNDLLELEISLGSLYKSDIAASDLLRRMILVRANGHLVMRHLAESYPTKDEEIKVGLNSIGASTCAERFTGEIVRVERIGLFRL
jgi:hypothetical protein